MKPDPLGPSCPTARASPWLPRFSAGPALTTESFRPLVWPCKGHRLRGPAGLGTSPDAAPGEGPFSLLEATVVFLGKRGAGGRSSVTGQGVGNAAPRGSRGARPAGALLTPSFSLTRALSPPRTTVQEQFPGDQVGVPPALEGVTSGTVCGRNRMTREHGLRLPSFN